MDQKTIFDIWCNNKQRLLNCIVGLQMNKVFVFFFLKSTKVFLIILKHTYAFTLLEMNIKNFNFAHVVVQYTKCELLFSFFAYEIFFIFYFKNLVMVCQHWTNTTMMDMYLFVKRKDLSLEALYFVVLFLKIIFEFNSCDLFYFFYLYFFLNLIFYIIFFFFFFFFASELGLGLSNFGLHGLYIPIIYMVLRPMGVWPGIKEPPNTRIINPPLVSPLKEK